jgi:hypothetical protein
MSLMVLGHFLRRRIGPLQQRSRMACMYTGPNDYCRIAHGPGTDFTRAELEVSIRRITGEDSPWSHWSSRAGSRPSARTRRCGQRSWRRCRPSMRVASRSGRLEVTPIVGSISPVPHPTASNAPARVPADPATEVRPPPGKRKGKNRSQNATTSKVWAAPQPGEMTRRGEQLPPGAARRRGPGPGGSSAVTSPTWGAGPQAPEDGGGGGAEQLSGSATSAATAAAAGDPAAVANDAAPSDAATTTIGARATSPTPAAGSALSGRPPPEDRGVFSGKGDPLNRSGRLGVARLHVSSLLELFFVPFNL